MSDMLQWFVENADVKVHEGLYIKESSVDNPCSGRGLFFDKSKLKPQERETRGQLELLRIPKKCTFNVYQLNSLLHDVSQYSNERECQKTRNRLKSAINDLLSIERFKYLISDSVVLVSELLILHLIRGEYEIPRLVDYYMTNVLLETDINSIFLSDDPNVHLYDDIFPSQLFFKVFELLDSFLKISVPERPCSIKFIKQMFSIVKSRTLEIPHQISAESEDFTVETTLVPLLDFANHDVTLNNAYFDIDRVTEDVLLLLEDTKVFSLSNDEVFEIFISYSPTEDVLHFNGIYGFAPKTENGSQYFNISFDRSYLEENHFLNLNLRVVLKWLSINPTVQMIRYNGKWYINDTGAYFASLLLPFIHRKSNQNWSIWEYDPKSYRTFTFFEMSYGKNKGEEDLIKTYAKRIRLLESDGRDFIGLPPLALTMSFDSDGRTYRGRFTAEEALELAPFHDAEIFESSITSFSNYFLKFLKWKLSILFKIQHTTVCESSFTNIISTEIDIIKSVLTDGKLSFWTDLKPETQESPVNYPKAPLRKTSDETIISDIVSNRVAVDDSFETMQGYDPNDQTDFLTEELAKYRSFFLRDT